MHFLSGREDKKSLALLSLFPLKKKKRERRKEGEEGTMNERTREGQGQPGSAT